MGADGPLVERKKIEPETHAVILRSALDGAFGEIDAGSSAGSSALSNCKLAARLSAGEGRLWVGGDGIGHVPRPSGYALKAAVSLRSSELALWARW
jgi:hypothetical protein